MRLLIVVAAALLAGCMEQPRLADDSMRWQPVLLDEEGLLDGGIGKEWTWEVRPGYQSFRVCVMFEPAGAANPVVVLPRVQLRHDHDDGFEVHGRAEVATVAAPGCWFSYEDGAAGFWTLRLDAEGGRARWVAQVDVVY